MLLPGRLSEATLGDVLGRLYRERATGTLELIETRGPSAGRSHRVRLDQGLVSAVDSSLTVARLGEILRDQGFIGDDSLRLLSRRLAQAPNARSGSILVDDVKISPRLVGAALRRQLRLRLDALFRLDDAEVRFHVPRPSDADRRSVPLSPREFLHGRARARDRRSRSSSGHTERKSQPHDRASGKERARVLAFGLLGLEVGATRVAIQRAFRRQAARVHPDRHPGASAARMSELMKQFAELSAAYHLLVA